MSRGSPSITADPGSFVIAGGAAEELLGLVSLERRPARRPGHVTMTGNEFELSYLQRRGYWGQELQRGTLRCFWLLLRNATKIIPCSW